MRIVTWGRTSQDVERTGLYRVVQDVQAQTDIARSYERAAGRTRLNRTDAIAAGDADRRKKSKGAAPEKAADQRRRHPGRKGQTDAPEFVAETAAGAKD
ncbi:hypothetical protein [uncultured Bradyrhizobium sp.]|uniref:hypothetical protein n=1 Tax=uncultured Bradyrhizobium sp. TaxID=199684 RepID=UPI0035CC86F5